MLSLATRRDGFMMSDQNGHRGGPPQDNQQSDYPPPPGEEDDRQRPPYPQGTPVTLPPIHPNPNDPYAGRYAPDPRAHGNYAASPTGANGFPPPGGYPSLPPVQPPPEQRHGFEARGYYESRGSSFPPPPPPEYNYYTHRPSTGPPYGNYDYARGPAPQAQAAPRQRTSIACSYCRRRKIRCSGYGTHDGVCSNCKKTGNKCVFQPVSSSSTTAFVPVSAVPGGVPPGTPLYGAFGQPLAPGGGPPGQPGPGGALPPPAAGGQPYPGPPPQQQPQPEGFNAHSPRSGYQYPPLPDDPNARRRPHEEEHVQRLPPPQPYGEPDPRRRSPASTSQGGTPPQAQYDYPPGYDGRERTDTPRHDSPNSPQQGNGGPMSLHALMDQNPPPRPPPSADSNRDIDQSMLGRLNRRT